MAHNTRHKGQRYTLPSWTTCKHCGTRGDGLEHFTVRCTCGASGVYCTAHSRTDWGDFSAITCATMRRMLVAEEHDAEIAERDAERREAEELAGKGKE